MSVDVEMEDEAEKITRLDYAKRSKRSFWITGIVFVAYIVARLLHWILGFPASVKELDIDFAAILITIYCGLSLELLSIKFREMRIRSKETNLRLTEIEREIASQAKRVSKRLSAIEGNLSGPKGNSWETPSGDEEDNGSSADTEPEGDEVLIAKYGESAERGEAWGQHNLGITYYNGTRVAKDYVMAAFWFRKAAEQGDDEAQLHLADILRSGEGLPADYGEALKWYRNLVEQESSYRNIAEDRLGDMYANGEGIPKDYAEAARWWERAAEHGWTWGHYRLGELYARGDEGVPQNYDEAYFRLHIATEGKGLGAMQKNAIDGRNKCAIHLTPEALFQTQERARKWIEGHPSKANPQ